MGPPWAPYYSHNTPIFESLKIWEVYGSRLPEGGPMSLGITLDKTLQRVQEKLKLAILQVSKVAPSYSLDTHFDTYGCFQQ